MKLLKFSLVLLCSFIIFHVTEAQDSKNFSKVSYGYSTMDQYFKTNSKTLPENFSRTNIKSKGAVFLSFNHSYFERISLGICIGSTKITSSIVSNNQRVGILNRNLYTIAIESTISYFKKNQFQLYGMAGLGYSFGKDQFFTISGETGKGYVGFAAFQLSPVSIKFGNKIAAFAELGFGYKGIVNLGFSYGL